MCGDLLLTASGDAMIKVWRVTTAPASELISNGNDSGNGTTLVATLSGHSDAVMVLRATEAASARARSGHGSSASSMKTESLVYSGCNDRTVRVWDMDTLSCRRTLKVSPAHMGSYCYYFFSSL